MGPAVSRVAHNLADFTPRTVVARWASVGTVLAEKVRFPQNRMGSWLTSLPRSPSRASTFLGDSGKRM